MGVAVHVRGLHQWVDAERLLGPGLWTRTVDGWRAELDRPAAADLQARLRGVGLGGQALEVDVRPRLKRKLVRDARSIDARRRRDTTPGFTHAGARLDDEGRMSLTPEALALALGRRARQATVLDVCGGCGGNAIGFARAGCRVTTVEPSRARLEMARHNAGLYDVADRIDFVHGRAEDVLTGASCDLVYADPPWGEDWNRSVTTPADVPLLAAIMDRTTGPLWLKLPPSFDVGTLPDFRPEAWFGEAAGDRRRVKFLLLTRP